MNYSPKVLQDQFLQANKSELVNIKSELEQLFEKFTPAQKKWKPNQKAWSIEEVTAHMAQTLKVYVGKLEPAKTKIKDKGLVQISAFTPGWLGGLFIKLLSPESSIKLKTFGVFKPEPVLVKGNPETELYDYISRMINYIIDIDGYDLKKVTIGSPLSSLIRFSVGEAIEINVVHLMRHITQIRKVASLSGFPKN